MQVVYNDYFACDPEKDNTCQSHMRYVETTLPTFEKTTLWSNPAVPGTDFSLIESATDHFQVYPEVGEYFRLQRSGVMPLRQADPTENCSIAAKARAGAAFVGFSTVLGFKAAVYTSSDSTSQTTVSYLPGAFCVPARTVYVWKGADPQHVPRPTYHEAEKITVGFSDRSVLVPPVGVTEKMPLDLRHDVFVHRSTMNNVTSKADAEADWNKRLGNGQLRSEIQLNNKWLIRNGRSGEVMPVN
jgi:hypothetical protein